MGEALRFMASIVLVNGIVEAIWRVVAPGVAAILDAGLPVKLGGTVLKAVGLLVAAGLSAAFTVNAVAASPSHASWAPWLGGLAYFLSPMSCAVQADETANAAEKRRRFVVFGPAILLLYAVLLHAPAVSTNPGPLLAAKGLAWILSVPMLGFMLNLWALWRALTMLASAGLILSVIGLSSVLALKEKRALRSA